MRGMVPWTTEQAWGGPRRPAGGPQGLGHNGLKNRSWGCGHAWQRSRGDGARQSRAAWADRGPRSLQPTAGLRKLPRGVQGGRHAEPRLPGGVLSYSRLAELAGQCLLLQAPRRGGHQRGPAGVPGPCLLGGEGTPLRGPCSESGGPNGQKVGAAHQEDRTPSAVWMCCGPSGPRLSPRRTGSRSIPHPGGSARPTSRPTRAQNEFLSPNQSGTGGELQRSVVRKTGQI